jgi:hypothetical protein
MSGWRPSVVMQCACGGFLVADHANKSDVCYEVMRHNSTERHAAWRVKQEPRSDMKAAANGQAS